MFQLAKYIRSPEPSGGRPKQIKHGDKHSVQSRMNQNMPEEIFDVDKFVKASDRAEYCSIKRLRKTVKLKLRTPSKLYTIKVEPMKAEEIIKKLRCEIREV